MDKKDRAHRGRSWAKLAAESWKLRPRLLSTVSPTFSGSGYVSPTYLPNPARSLVMGYRVGPPSRPTGHQGHWWAGKCQGADQAPWAARVEWEHRQIQAHLLACHPSRL